MIADEATDKMLIAEELRLSNDHAHSKAVKTERERSYETGKGADRQESCQLHRSSTMDCSHGHKYDQATFRSRERNE